MKKLLPLLLFTLPLSAFSMKEQLCKGQSGDFIVSERDKRGELLRLHTITQDSVILEEIVFPATLKLKGVKAWQEFLEQGAPGHTSWTLLEIDIKGDTLLECFSFTRSAWLEFQESDLMLLKILPLSLKPLSSYERKRIGPPPVEGQDNRKIWNPELFFDGIKKKGANCNVYGFLYPKEASPLSGKQFEIYYDAENKEFPFPYLIRITDDSNASYNIRVTDSGRGLLTALPELPRRGICFTKAKEVTEEGLFLHLSIPNYYKELQIQAIGKEKESPILLSYTRKGEAFFISQEELHKKLSKEIGYTFKVSALSPLLTSAESKETFFLGPYTQLDSKIGILKSN
jgi:hypothetical protein